MPVILAAISNTQLHKTTRLMRSLNVMRDGLDGIQSTYHHGWHTDILWMTYTGTKRHQDLPARLTPAYSAHLLDSRRLG